ncbi:MAG TPA: AraC family transcriptional regulator [Novosphingobium sp.]
MDPLSDVISVLRPHTTLSKPITATGDWGVRYAAYGLPGYALVLEGACWLTVAGREATLLQAGDFVLLPASPAFEMASQPGMACVEGKPSGEPIHYGAAQPPDLCIFGGSFQIERANALVLHALLPEMVHLCASDIDTRGLSRIVELIREESVQERPGGDLILQKLLEIMLVEVLRSEPLPIDDARTGLLRGLGDPDIAKALRALHADVPRRWTVAGLAAIAGMSRSAFAARFKATVGSGPLDYLGRWRIALAKDALIAGRRSLDRLAEEIGYESASAFSTAFRRHVGCAPGGFARLFAS